MCTIHGGGSAGRVARQPGLPQPGARPPDLPRGGAGRLPAGAGEGQPGWLTGRAAQAALAAEIRAATPTRGPQEPPTPAALARLHETLLRARRRPAVRAGWAGRVPAHPPHRRAGPLSQPAAGHRHPYQPSHGRAAPRGHHPRPALRVPGLRHPTERLPGPPHPKNAPTVARPASPTWCCSARSTTSSPCTNGAGPSPCTPTGRSPRTARTAPAPCTATAHPAAPPSRLALCLLRAW